MVKIKTSIQEPFERTYRTLVCIQKTHQIDQNVKILRNRSGMIADRLTRTCTTVLQKISRRMFSCLS